MKTLLENYIKLSDKYSEMLHAEDREEYDMDLAKELDAAGKALRKAAKEKGMDIPQLKSHLYKFNSSNISRYSNNKSYAEQCKGRREHNIRILETFLGIK
ncbi:hypothetical protein [Escherichia phage vB_EcoM-pJBB]|nr:hypothetical protein [Escherichia phage vB_EcoM-pEB20]